MSGGEQTPQSDPDEPSSAAKPKPDSSIEPLDLGDPGDFEFDLAERTPPEPEKAEVEARGDDPGDFSSDRMPTEE